MKRATRRVTHEESTRIEHDRLQRGLSLVAYAAWLGVSRTTVLHLMSRNKKLYTLTLHKVLTKIEENPQR